MCRRDVPSASPVLADTHNNSNDNKNNYYTYCDRTNHDDGPVASLAWLLLITCRAVSAVGGSALWQARSGASRLRVYVDVRSASGKRGVPGKTTKPTKSDMEYWVGKIGDPMESDGAICPDLQEVRSDFSEAFGQFRVSLALTVGPWAGHLAGRRALRAGFAA